METTTIDQDQIIFTVSRLNQEARGLLEKNFGLIFIEGEISNFAAPQSGHWYFSLKDTGAQVRCAMFRAHQRQLGFTPKDGMHVLLKARVSLYENRGEYQLIAESIEERGEGKLQRAYELLKKKLAAAGLFDEAHKKSLPTFPKQIGVITSATGAAIHDILTVLKRRCPLAAVIIYPTAVQGEMAAPQIVQALAAANRRNECDVLILARGGGSLEDLWPFNEEIVAHAIFESRIPTVSAVGHEVDFTIADFVADKRAPTPSAAAEIITPNCADLLAVLTRQSEHLVRRMREKFAALKQQCNWIAKHLSQQHPKRRLREQMQHLDFCEMQLHQLQERFLAHLQTQCKALFARLDQQQPTARILQLQQQLHFSEQQLKTALQHLLEQKHQQLAHIASQLNTLSPLATLTRGYSIATNAKKEILFDANQVTVGETFSLQLAKGKLTCDVTHVITGSTS